MKIILLLLFTFCLGVVLPQHEPNEFVQFQHFDEKILIVKAGDVYPDMVVAVKSEKGIIIFDTGISPTLTKEYREIIEREFPGSKISYVINTHHHFDHTNGNQIFAEAIIIAHENCKPAMAQAAQDFDEFIKYRRERYTRRNELAETLDPSTDLYKRLKDLVFMSSHMCDDLETIFHLTLPDLTFADKLEIDLGNMTLKLFHFTPRFHTDNDMIAVIPELGLIFTGDILPEIESVSWITSENDLERAVEVLDNVIGNCGEIKNVGTIHGGILTVERLINFRNSLAEMAEQKASKKSAVAKIEEVVSNYGANESSEIMNDIIADGDYYLWEGDLVALADKLFSYKKQQQGLSLFELNAKIFPESVNAHEWLGDAYFQMEKYEQAKESFQKALQLYPVDSFAADMIYQIYKLQEEK